MFDIILMNNILFWLRLLFSYSPSQINFVKIQTVVITPCP